MEDYSESSSVRMEREMMMDESHRSAASSAMMEDNDSSNSSLAAFDSEIRRMTRDADKILNDIRQEGAKHNDRSFSSSNKQQNTNKPTPTVIPEEYDDDDDDDTVGDDASLKGELERLDRVSLEIRKSLDDHDRAIPAASPWKFPTAKEETKGANHMILVTNIFIWGLVLYLMVHASFRLVDSDGYLRLLL